VGQAVAAKSGRKKLSSMSSKELIIPFFM
jgi:hypothetical protein